MELEIQDLVVFSQLDFLYHKMRVLQGRHNSSFETHCIGKGNCCKIGLQLPMMECANIAYNIKLEHGKRMEMDGEVAADAWLQTVIDALVLRMHDELWTRKGGTSYWCAFYDEGCTIYGYRPQVCRAYGTIIGVDETCPRKRNANDSVDILTGDYVSQIVHEYQSLVNQYNTLHEDMAYVVYMPLGVLRFMLSDQDMRELVANVDPKFLNADALYDMQFIRLHEEAVKKI